MVRNTLNFLKSVLFSLKEDQCLKLTSSLQLCVISSLNNFFHYVIFFYNLHTQHIFIW